MKLDYPKRPRVYLSAPMSNGGKLSPEALQDNVLAAEDMACQLMDDGYAVLSPQLSFYLDGTWREKADHAFWISRDLAWVGVAEAVFRIPGESKGADEECEYAKRLGIPVVTSLAQLQAILPADIGGTYDDDGKPTAEDIAQVGSCHDGAIGNGELRRFSTGAVRSKDADAYRFDLITPIGMKAWIQEQLHNCESALDHLDESNPTQAVLFRNEQRNDHLLECLYRVFTFLSGDTDPISLIAAFCYLDDAARIDGEPLIFGVAKAYQEGASRYGNWNWERGMPADSILNHAVRHIFLAIRGDTDEDHCGHAGWGLLAAYHSLKLWPHLNAGKFRLPGCKPPAAKNAPELEPTKYDIEEFVSDA